MAPPAFGKTSICRALFTPARVTVVAGDGLIAKIASKKLQAPAALVEAVVGDSPPLRIKAAIERVFAAGLGPALVDVWLTQAGDGDFALDSHVPDAYHALVEQIVRERGYLVVTLDWSRFGTLPPSSATASTLVSEYYAWLEQRDPAFETSTDPALQRRMASHKGMSAIAHRWNHAASRGAASAGASCPARVSHVRALFDTVRSVLAGRHRSARSRARSDILPK